MDTETSGSANETTSRPLGNRVECDRAVWGKTLNAWIRYGKQRRRAEQVLLGWFQRSRRHLTCDRIHADIPHSEWGDPGRCGICHDAPSNLGRLLAGANILRLTHRLSSG
jgi:hypothetical protein